MTDWIDDLARKAEAATPGPWEWGTFGASKVLRQGDRTVTAWQVPTDLTLEEDRAWIAAANPATILRLIEDNRRWREMYAAQVHLAHVADTKVAAVEAVLDGAEAEAGEAPLTRVLRAALDTTTKESR